ncbi:MAG: 4-oxalomesaconate tautomerase [Sphingomonadaceae bacterium]
MSAEPGIPCTWMRGGTSKGGVFRASDLPADPAERDRLLLRIMGSPDPRQIDGMGGGDPLTSKVALVSPSRDPAADVDYLFLQVWVAEPRVSAEQVCGNMLAAVAPFAIEKGLVPAVDGETRVRIRQVNDGSLALATVQTPGGQVTYSGDTAIDGVPGTAAPVWLSFGTAPRLPTGRAVDEVAGHAATLIDAGMPLIVLEAAAFGLSGRETPAALDADAGLKARVEAVRRAAGPLMGLGDVAGKTVPKVALVAPPAGDGTIATRSLIPHRVHAAIGVLAAVGVAAATLLPAGPAARVARPGAGRVRTIGIEHPAGRLECRATLADDGTLGEAAVVRTARKLMQGRLFA